MIRKKTIEDVEKDFFAGRKVFVRVDFNVPIKNGLIQDDARIVAALPTINYLMERDAKIILASHLGRPKGERLPEFSLQPVAERLSQLLNKKVYFAPDCVGESVKELINSLKERDILLLENLRFHNGEEKNDPEFSKELASLADIYVNDAFGAAHRRHASCHQMALNFEVKLAGLLMKKELEFLTKVRDNPERPSLVILGGAKVKDKIGVIENLMEKVDQFLIGGGMAYTFLKAKGLSIGSSLFDEGNFNKVKTLIEKNPEKFILPEDHLVVKEVKEGATSRTVKGGIEDGWIGVDIGPQTIKKFKSSLKGKGTLFWNGPLGVFEIDNFSKGTVEMALAIKEETKRGVLTVTGGGDTLSAMKKVGLTESDISHASTGGGATLEFLAGLELPGVQVLTDL